MKLISLVLLLSTLHSALSCHGFIRDLYEAKLKKQWDAIWIATGTVPSDLGVVPDQPLRVSFGNIDVTPNDRLEQSQMRSEPTVSWRAEPGALYTLILEDQDVTLPRGSFKYAHWMVSNIQGSDVSTGDVNIPYVPSGPFEMKNNNTEVDMSLDYTHRYVFLVYKQPGRINADESVPEGCSRVVVFDHDALQAKYNLQGPEAGNFYRCGFSIEYFTAFSCSFSKCIGFPFRVPIPGINDGAECTA